MVARSYSNHPFLCALVIITLTTKDTFLCDQTGNMLSVSAFHLKIGFVLAKKGRMGERWAGFNTGFQTIEFTSLSLCKSICDSCKEAIEAYSILQYSFSSS